MELKCNSRDLHGGRTQPRWTDLDGGETQIFSSGERSDDTRIVVRRTF